MKKKTLWITALFLLLVAAAGIAAGIQKTEEDEPDADDSVKMLLAETYAVSQALCRNKEAVFAGTSDSARYDLYYNSPVNRVESVICGIYYYSDLNYFTVSSLSGNAYAIEVLCSGCNVSMETLSASKEGTQSFRYSGPAETEIAKFRVGMTHTDGMTAYASGRVSAVP